MRSSTLFAAAGMSYIGAQELSGCNNSCVGEHRGHVSRYYNVDDKNFEFSHSNSNICGSSVTNWYTVPGLPRYDSNDKIGGWQKTNGCSRYWCFKSNWDNEPFDPMLIVLT